MPNRVFYTDGNAVKYLNVWDNPAAWTWLGGGPLAGDEKTAKDYFGKVPWLYRGVGLIAGTVASMPFIIYKGDKEFETSDDYANKTGIIPNPKRLLWLIAASRVLTGRAYLFREQGERMGTKRLRYLNPLSVRPVFGDRKETAGEILAWEREVTIAKGQTEWIEFEPEDIVYLWQGDPYVEIGPPINYPARAALAAAGVLLNVDEFAAGFFKRGGVKGTLFTVAGNIQPAERARLQRWIDELFSGIRNAFRQGVINAESVTPVVIGEGLEGLGDSELTKEKREDISQALGIPTTKLFSSDASGLGGGGVVQQDDERFYRETIIPEAEAIFDDLNRQVFDEMKLRIELNTGALDVFQEDEQQRSTSLQQIVQAVDTNPRAVRLGMSLLGYELSDEDAAELDAMIEDKEATSEKMEAQTEQKPPEQPKPMPDEMGMEMDMDAEMMGKRLTEIGRWQRHALRVGGPQSAAKFEPEHLDDTLVGLIRGGLENASDKDAVKTVFADARGIVERSNANEIVALLEAIRMSIEAQRA